MLRPTMLFTAAGFVILSVASRAIVEHVETRWQIVGWWVVATLVQFWVVPRFGFRPSLAELAIDALCIVAGCVTVKWALEGTPF